MKAPRARTIAAVACAVACASAASPAIAAPAKILVAGPANDPIATRVVQELRANGFTPVPHADLTGCSPAAIEEKAAREHVVGAMCTNGVVLVVWSMEGTTIRLKDFGMPRAEDPRAKETLAVRATEVMRANLRLDGNAATTALESPRTDPVEFGNVQLASIADLGPNPRRDDGPSDRPHRRLGGVEYVAIGLGSGALMGVDASVPVLSTNIEVALTPRFAPFLRLDGPLGHVRCTRYGSLPLDVSPGFVAAGVHVPLTSADSFVIPRIGGALALVWLAASRSTPDPMTMNDLHSFAGILDADASFRVAGPLRFTPGFLVGSTVHRLVEQSGTVRVAYWGQPFIELAARVEVQVR